MFFKVSNQIVIMFLLMAVGFVCDKIKLISKQGADQFSSVLLYIVAPCVIIDSYQIEYDITLVKGLMATFALSLGIHLVKIVIVSIIYPKNPDGKYKVERFGTMFTNCGFIGLPLIDAVLGAEGVFYTAAYIAMFNLIQWTYGKAMMQGKSDLKSTLKSFLNPSILALFIGLIMFFSGLRFPSTVATSVKYLASLNTPVAMIILGTFISRSNILSVFKNIRIYFIALISLVVLPLITLVSTMFLPIHETVFLTCFIISSCPSAVTTALFAAKFGGDELYASQLITLTTLLSAFTLPLLMLLLSVI